MKKFLGVQPKTFNTETYSREKIYYISKKLDGERRLLMLNGGKSYLINSKLQKFYIPFKTSLKNTLLDCELFKNKLYILDILYFNGKNVMKENLDNRIKLMNSVAKKNKGILTVIKYYKGKDIYKIFQKIKNRFSKQFVEGGLDGLIFKPNGGYKETPLKWKPISLLSIDFKVKKEGNTLILLKQNGEQYIPKNSLYKDVGVVNVSNGEIYSDGDVVEFIFKNGGFTPLRIRYDKTKSNYDTVIESNFKSILNPVDMKKILKR